MSARGAFARRCALWGSSLLIAALLAGCAGGSARPKPAELPPNVALVGVRQAWTARLPAIAFPLQVSVQGKQVALAASDGTVVTLDAASGREAGRASAGAALSAGVGSDGRTLAVVTRENQVVALEGGRELWRRKLVTQSYTAPLVAGGRVFVLGADRSLTAFDGRNGAQLWRLDRPAEPLVLRQAGMLQAVGNTLVAGMAGRMVGVDPDNGSVRWEAPLASARGTNDVERLIDLVGGASRQANVLCARAFQASIGCVDTSNGTVRWSKPASGSTGVAGDGQRLFGVESDGRVLAWRADTGDRAWIADHLHWRQLTGPLVLGRSVVVGDSTGVVHLLSREDGSPLNRLSTDGSGIAATPVLADNTLVVVTRNGAVYGFVPE
ncbi:outer membrane protein assembly factor BamB [Ottowia testudinis]|uniref:Outer membrane protein assembly factor BamB n=1 Tax=Ottowia testudinis TaxID=2816950 RepID=A0A975CEM3_9BURK|nr:outer membrane protein assembly factor BamB [Ottowia testudinis]QTD44427.1 outer membrane protein assembly factor BamB [Ottowia testudinis]